MNNKKIKRVTLNSFVILIGLFLIATVFIGNYLIDYALVPNNGAEERNVNEENQSLNIINTNQLLIDENERQAILNRNKWLKEVEEYTHELELQSEDNLTLRGHSYVQEENTSQWAIVVHGYQSDETESQTTAHYYYEEGYNVLTMDLRAHGNSEGQYIGMGYLDKDDLIKWTELIIQEDSDAEIIYHGTSMGGATVLMAGGSTNLPSNVKSIVSDCAYSSIWGIFTSELDVRFNLPSFPFLNMGQLMGGIRAGYNIAEGEVAEFVRLSEVPILFIHSEPDDFVPVAMVYELFEAKESGDKELVITDIGGHGQAKYADLQSYFTHVFSFHNKYIQNKGNQLSLT